MHVVVPVSGFFHIENVDIKAHFLRRLFVLCYVVRFAIQEHCNSSHVPSDFSKIGSSLYALEGRRERYVAERLKREGRGGSVTERPDGTIVYERRASDSMEMLPFLRTFTGRILSLRGDNRRMLRRFHDDLRRMEALYTLVDGQY